MACSGCRAFRDTQHRASAKHWRRVGQALRGRQGPARRPQQPGAAPEKRTVLVGTSPPTGLAAVQAKWVRTREGVAVVLPVLDYERPAPLYQPLADVLLRDTADGRLPAGLAFPSEGELVGLLSGHRDDGPERHRCPQSGGEGGVRARVRQMRPGVAPTSASVRPELSSVHRWPPLTAASRRRCGQNCGQRPVPGAAGPRERRGPVPMGAALWAWAGGDAVLSGSTWTPALIYWWEA